MSESISEGWCPLDEQSSEINVERLWASPVVHTPESALGELPEIYALESYL